MACKSLGLYGYFIAYYTILTTRIVNRAIDIINSLIIRADLYLRFNIYLIMAFVLTLGNNDPDCGERSGESLNIQSAWTEKRILFCFLFFLLNELCRDLAVD